MFGLFSGNSKSELKHFKFDSYHLKATIDLKRAEPDVLKVSNILLNEPSNLAKRLRADAADFLIEWMMATDDYMFGYRGKYNALIEEREDLGTISCAAQIKYCLEHKVEYSSEPEAEYQIMKLFAQYVANPNNNIKPNKEIKKMIAALESDTLKAFVADY
jgi:hypothetical protein